MSSTDFMGRLAKACDDAGIDPLPAIREINAMVDASGIDAYYIVVGPIPDFPGIKLDVSLLTKDCLYNYVITEERPSNWTVHPLARISHIVERALEAPEYISLLVHGMAEPTIVIQEEFARKDLLDSFLSSLTRKTLEVLKASQFSGIKT